MPIGHFLVDYKREERGKMVLWYLPFYREHMADILAADGFASECEIDGKRAILTARAPQKLLNKFGKQIDPEVEWTSTRAKSKGKRVPTKLLATHLSEVLNEAEWKKVKEQSEALMRRADKEGYIQIGAPTILESRRLLAIVGSHGYGLDKISTGTFPTTSVIDNFNRAAIGANYTAAPFGYGGALVIVSSTLLGGANAEDDNSAYYNVATYGPHTEAYITYVTKNTDDGYGPALYIRLTDVGNDCYSVDIQDYGSATDQITKSRLDDGVPIQLDSDIAQEIAAGDSFGVEMIGSTLTPYYKSGASAWVAKTPSSDATYTAAGYIGIYIPSNVARLDNLGGGTYAGVTYTDTGLATVSGSAASGSVALTSSDTGIVKSEGKTSGADAAILTDTGIVKVSASTLSGADVLVITETGLVKAGNLILSGADTGVFIDSGLVASAGLASGSVVLIATDTGIVKAELVASGADEYTPGAVSYGGYWGIRIL